MGLFLSFKVFAIGCDCEIRIFSPLTGPQTLPSWTLNVFKLEEYSSFSSKNLKICRDSCLKKFQSEVLNNEIYIQLLSYSEDLIKKRLIGFNCTGVTTLKFPVRVKASLGNLGIGNVADFIQVINLQEVCFD
jgi:hypothetical protein